MWLFKKRLVKMAISNTQWKRNESFCDENKLANNTNLFKSEDTWSRI